MSVGEPTDDGVAHERDEEAGETPNSGAVDHEDIGGRATRSTGWAILGYGGSQILRFIGNLILTRLLFEEAFGMMAIVNVLLQGLALFSDIGTGPSIIQNERGDDPRFLNTAWTMQVSRGFFLWGIAAAISWPMAKFYDEPDLLVLLPLVGMSSVFQGLYSTNLFTASRHLNLKQLTIVNVGSQAVGLVTMVVWALVSPTLYALVAGAMVTPFVQMILSHTVLPGPRNGLAWDRDSAKVLFSFGRWIFLSTVLTFATGHADRLIFGKLIPLDLLGVYSIGSMLALMPSWGMGHLTFSVTFPLYSRAKDAGQALRPFVKRVRYPLLLLGAWAISGMVGGGQVAIDLLYDERYAEAGWIVQLISVMSWLMILDDTNRAALLAKGTAHWLVSGGVAKLIGMIVLIPLGFQQFGFKGAVAGFVLAEGLKLIVTIFGVLREKIGSVTADLGLSVLGAASATACWFAAQAVASLGAHAAVQAIVVFLTACVVFSVAFVPFGLRVKREGNPLRVEIPDPDPAPEASDATEADKGNAS